MSGLSWLGVLVTSSLPSPLTMSHAHPLPNWVAPALAKDFHERLHSPEVASEQLRQVPFGRVGSTWTQDFPIQRVIEMPSTVVAQRTVFGLNLRQQGLEAAVSHHWPSVQRCIQFAHVPGVVLAMVDFHGGHINRWSQCVNRKPQGRQTERFTTVNLRGRRAVRASWRAPQPRGEYDACARGASDF